MSTSLLREYVSVILESDDSFDIDKVPYDPKGFGNLDYVLLLLVKNGPMQRKDIVAATQRWRDAQGRHAKIDLASMFENTTGFFEALGKGMWTLSTSGMGRAAEASKRARKIIASPPTRESMKPGQAATEAYNAIVADPEISSLYEINRHNTNSVTIDLRPKDRAFFDEDAEYGWPVFETRIDVKRGKSGGLVATVTAHVKRWYHDPQDPVKYLSISEQCDPLRPESVVNAVLSVYAKSVEKLPEAKEQFAHNLEGYRNLHNRRW